MGQWCIALARACWCTSFRKKNAESSTSSIGSSDVRVAIVDGMAEVQSLDKPDWIKTCKDLAEHFMARLFVKYNNTQQIRLIFDRYGVLSLLKSATRSKRQGTPEPIYYHVMDSTHIAKVTLKKLLSHTKTKAELTAFLAQKVMERGEATGKQVIVAWATECKATHKDVSHLQSDHEEADTKIILHALDTIRSILQTLTFSASYQTLSRDHSTKWKIYGTLQNT